MNDPFVCAHCSHRLDIHTRTPGVRLPDADLEGLFGPAVLTCFHPGCECRYAPVPPTAAAWERTLCQTVDDTGHLDLERWEAELAP